MTASPSRSPSPTLDGVPWPVRAIRAPQAEGATLIDPPSPHLGEVMAAWRLRRDLSAADGSLTHSTPPIHSTPTNTPTHSTPPLVRWADENSAGTADLGAAWPSPVAREIFALATQAREEILAAAVTHVRRYRDMDAPAIGPETTVLLAGHQPELFHVGVWWKNFVLSAMAERINATGGSVVPLNLVVDYDLATSSAIRSPVTDGDPTDPGAISVRPIPFDQGGPVVPHEERAIRDRPTFNSFGSRVAETVRPWVSDPLVTSLWPEVHQAVEAGLPLSLALAAGRHRLEGRWGLTTYEVPFGAIAATGAFHRFVALAMSDAPRLTTVYNHALRLARSVQRIRSAAHPAPDLAIEGEARELPFWVWRAEDPTRRKLVLTTEPGGRVRLSDGASWSVRLGPCADVSDLAARLAQLADEGVKIRPRALMATLFTRAVLGEAFLHGIGGAKYDEVVDYLFRVWLGVEPPTVIALSQTRRLPLPTSAWTEAERHRLAKRLRDASWHPETWYAEPPVSTASANAALANTAPSGSAQAQASEAFPASAPVVSVSKPTWDGATRAAWDRQRLALADRASAKTAERHGRLTEARERLAAPLEPLRETLQQARRLADAALAHDRQLRSREFSWALFSEAHLREALTTSASEAAATLIDES